MSDSYGHILVHTLRKTDKNRIFVCRQVNKNYEKRSKKCRRVPNTNS